MLNRVLILIVGSISVDPVSIFRDEISFEKDSNTELWITVSQDILKEKISISSNCSASNNFIDILSANSYRTQ